MELKLVVGEIAVGFGATIVGTKCEKLDNGLKISSSELCDNFIKSDVESLVRFVADRKGGDMDDDAEKGSKSVPESGERL